MCSDEVDPEVIEILRREALRGRKHTGDSSWHDRSPAGKSLVEQSWLESLLKEFDVDGACPYAEPAPMRSLPRRALTGRTAKQF